MKINLHMHSNFSDGWDDLKTLANHINEHNILFSLTDHDTISGIKELEKYLKNPNKMIYGTEITTSFSFAKKGLVIHMLAYNFNYELMKIKMDEYHLIKLTKMNEFIKQLKKDGYQIDIPSKEIITKKDIAITLVKQKYFIHIKDANKLINQYREHRMFFYEAKEVIDLVHECGGVIIWAHPFDAFLDGKRIKLNKAEIESHLQILINLGLDGIECKYSLYGDNENNFLEMQAVHHHLIKSAGTDYHAKNDRKQLYFDIDPQFIKGILN